MTDKIAVYQAGPIQHVDGHGVSWREMLINGHPQINWLNPLAEYNHEDEDMARDSSVCSQTDSEAVRGLPKWTDEEIVEKDLEMIDEADAVIVNWELVPTAGTPMEVFYAYHNDTPVFVRTDVDDEDISPWLSYHSELITDDFFWVVLAIRHESFTMSTEGMEHPAVAQEGNT